MIQKSDLADTYPYTILGDVLYKQGKDKVLMRVVSLEESKRIMELCHEC